MRKQLILLFLLVFAVGCAQPIEMSARDGIATASGFLSSEVSSNKDTCQANPASGPCVAIKKAAQSLNVVIDALEVYCAGPAFNSGDGPCQPPNDKTLKDQLSQKLGAALHDLDRDVADVKKVSGAN